jgi:hypothetical protein
MNRRMAQLTTLSHRPTALVEAREANAVSSPLNIAWTQIPSSKAPFTKTPHLCANLAHRPTLSVCVGKSGDRKKGAAGDDQ